MLSVAAIGGGIAVLIWWQNDQLTTAGIAAWRIAALAAASIALLPPSRLALSLGFSILSLLDCTETCRSAVFLLLSFQGHPATYGMVSILSWSFAYQVLGIQAADGEGVRPRFQDEQEIIDRTFGCILTVSIVLGARNALVRYVLWGVLERAAQEQSQQLDRLQTVARRLTAPMKRGWIWPNKENQRGIVGQGRGHPGNTTSGGHVPSLSQDTPMEPADGPPGHIIVPGTRTGGTAHAMGLPSTTRMASVQEELQKASDARLRMYDELGVLHSVRREDRARLLARMAFRRACEAREVGGVRVGTLDRGRPTVQFGPDLPGAPPRPRLGTAASVESTRRMGVGPGPGGESADVGSKREGDPKVRPGNHLHSGGGEMDGVEDEDGLSGGEGGERATLDDDESTLSAARRGSVQGVVQ